MEHRKWYSWNKKIYRLCELCIVTVFDNEYQCLSPLMLWGRIPLMKMCTRYNMW
jgi:hypothetical protein